MIRPLISFPVILKGKRSAKTTLLILLKLKKAVIYNQLSRIIILIHCKVNMILIINFLKLSQISVILIVKIYFLNYFVGLFIDSRTCIMGENDQL